MPRDNQCATYTKFVLILALVELPPKKPGRSDRALENHSSLNDSWAAHFAYRIIEHTLLVDNYYISTGKVDCVRCAQTGHWEQIVSVHLMSQDRLFGWRGMRMGARGRVTYSRHQQRSPGPFSREEGESRCFYDKDATRYAYIQLCTQRRR